jgi:hypothetical protein
MSTDGITVTATGSASGLTDRAVLTLGATAVRGEVSDAMAVVGNKIIELFSVLQSHGIERSSIQTSDLSIWPEHNNDGAVVGFRVRNMVQVTTSKIGTLGEIIGQAAAALGDLAEMHGLAFEVADRIALEDQARARAFELATSRARQLAELAGARLGKAIEIIEASESGPTPMFKRAMAMAEAAPVQSGSATVDIHLTVRFSQFPNGNDANNQIPAADG